MLIFCRSRCTPQDQRGDGLPEPGEGLARVVNNGHWRWHDPRINIQITAVHAEQRGSDHCESQDQRGGRREGCQPTAEEGVVFLVLFGMLTLLSVGKNRVGVNMLGADGENKLAF